MHARSVCCCIRTQGWRTLSDIQPVLQPHLYFTNTNTVSQQVTAGSSNRSRGGKTSSDRLGNSLRESDPPLAIKRRKVQSSSARSMGPKTSTTNSVNKKPATKRKVGGAQSPLLTKRLKSMSTQSPLLTRKSQRLRKLAQARTTTPSASASVSKSKSSKPPLDLTTPEMKPTSKGKMAGRLGRMEGCDESPENALSDSFYSQNSNVLEPGHAGRGGGGGGGGGGRKGGKREEKLGIQRRRTADHTEPSGDVAIPTERSSSHHSKAAYIPTSSEVGESLSTHDSELVSTPNFPACSAAMRHKWNPLSGGLWIVGKPGDDANSEPHIYKFISVVQGKFQRSSEAAKRRVYVMSGSLLTWNL